MKEVMILVFLAGLGLAATQSPEQRRTGNICSVDMDCPDNAFCRLNSYCVCKDGFVYAAVNSTHKGCFKEARMGEECVQNIQCHSTMGVHSQCVNGVCDCIANSHLEDDRCYETSGVYSYLFGTIAVIVLLSVVFVVASILRNPRQVAYQRSNY